MSLLEKHHQPNVALKGLHLATGYLSSEYPLTTEKSHFDEGGLEKNVSQAVDCPCGKQMCNKRN